MISLNETIDLLRRRTNGCLKVDGIDKVYLTFLNGKESGILTFFLKDDLPQSEVTKLAVKYQHIFSDHITEYSIRLQQPSMYYKKPEDTYSIWDRLTEFTL